MGKYKENARYNILSIRVTDAEKAAIEQLKRKTKKSITILMREAMLRYTSGFEAATSAEKMLQQ
jgi:predicted transcriptional regulator